MPVLTTCVGRSGRPGHGRRRAAVAAMLAATGILGSLSACAQQAPSASSRPGRTTPPAEILGRFKGVSAAPGGQAWAVGSLCSSYCGVGFLSGDSVIMRWNGHAWSRVPTPNLGFGATLTAVSAAPDGTAWAVGATCTSGCGTLTESGRTLILRWNGSKWSQVPAPSPGASAGLSDVSAGPGGSAWAVGTTCIGFCATSQEIDQALILHWDGAAWSAVSAPVTSDYVGLSGVTVAAGGDAWAVGFGCTVSCRLTPFRNGHPFVMRWNGSAWALVPAPRTSHGGILTGVSAAADGTAWAVGAACTSGCGTRHELHHSLVLRWNGTQWSQVPSPPAGGDSMLFSVNASQGGSALAVGYSCAPNCDPATGTDRTLILSWNGTAWLTAPAPTADDGLLYGVGVGPDGSAWAAGYACITGCGTSTELDQAVTFYRNGATWSAG